MEIMEHIMEALNLRSMYDKTRSFCFHPEGDGCSIEVISIEKDGQNVPPYTERLT